MTDVTKVYPLPEELCSVKNHLQCTEEGCTNIFTSESNLRMHLIKRHQRQPLKKLNERKQYYCPQPSCIYNQLKCFDKIKYLKQHYLKMHAVKNYICDVCHKGFATQAIKNTHSVTCGLTFQCTDCASIYGSHEALLTHCRRKEHRMPVTKKLPVKLKVGTKNAFILPKIILEQVVHHDKEIQTEPWVAPPKTKQKTVKRRFTQQTQTCLREKIGKSAETQTVGQCILKKNVQGVKGAEQTEEETQTKYEGPQTKSQFDVGDANNVMSLYNINFFDDIAFNTCETQTDVMYQDTFLESNGFTSHIETQTNDAVDLDLCSNTYTQTCNDLFSEFGFNDIQTQTTWPEYDMFVSTETQTNCADNMMDLSLHNREISHMETQTESEFKQLLEEINA